MVKRRSIKLLIIAELDGEISIDEKKHLYEWISKSDINARYYTQIKDLWESSLSHASDVADTSNEWSRLKIRLSNHKISKPTRKINWFRVAAIVTIGLLLTNTIRQHFDKPEPRYYTAMAPYGSISKTLLPDGTLVYINAGSEIKFDLNMDDDSREVDLIQGEAWFDVAKNKEQPFTVRTPIYDVQVLGTQFSIKSYRDDNTIVTTLEEGSIRILAKEDSSLKGELILAPGEQLTYNLDSKKFTKKNVDTSLYTAWKDNRLTFLNMSFADFIKLIKRKYDVNIEVNDTTILKEHYTGTIENETILDILDLLEHTHPIKYKIDGQKVVISRK